MKNPHAAALGKLGGKSKTAAKAAASRANGRKGGRPKAKDQAEALNAVSSALNGSGLTLALTVRNRRNDGLN